MPILFAWGTVGYAVFLGSACIALWLSKDTRKAPNQGISIIIAAKNEAKNLPNLLDSLRRLQYEPELFEIILVSDHSTDETKSIIEQSDPVTNLMFVDFQTDIDGLVGKKAALQCGISQAKYDILAFTDADCVVPQGWLKAISSRFDADTDYLLSYSIMKYEPCSGTLRLKNFERSIYYALAAAGLFFKKPITSSACNMAYRKSLFEQSGGFTGIGHLKSGDDDLLLMKMMPNIRKARFTADPKSLVVSYDGKDRAAHHHTNIRRASKFRQFPLYLKTLGAFVFMYFIAFYYILLMSVIGTKGASSSGVSLSLPLISSSIALKFLLEITLSATILTKAKQLQLLVLYPAQIFLFPLQFLFYAVRGSLGRYSWK